MKNKWISIILLCAGLSTTSYCNYSLTFDGTVVVPDKYGNQHSFTPGFDPDDIQGKTSLSGGLQLLLAALLGGVLSWHCSQLYFDSTTKRGGAMEVDTVDPEVLELEERFARLKTGVDWTGSDLDRSPKVASPVERRTL